MFHKLRRLADKTLIARVGWSHGIGVCRVLAATGSWPAHELIDCVIQESYSPASLQLGSRSTDQRQPADERLGMRDNNLHIAGAAFWSVQQQHMGRTQC